jgi:nucleoid-associated protein YgaU
VLERLEDGSRLVIERLDGDEGDGTATMRVVPSETVPPSAPPPPVTWIASRGDSLWSQAESVLAEAWGRRPSDSEVVGYWEALVEANRARLVDPQNADLIFAGQSFVLPPPPPA